MKHIYNSTEHSVQFHSAEINKNFVEDFGNIITNYFTKAKQISDSCQQNTAQFLALKFMPVKLLSFLNLLSLLLNLWQSHLRQAMTSCTSKISLDKLSQT